MDTLTRIAMPTSPPSTDTSLASDPQSLLRLLQLASPVLPVGAYTYSEGLETLVQSGVIHDSPTLMHWLTQEIRYGAIRVEAAMVIRTHQAVEANDLAALGYWNQWLSAMRDTEELRQQSWQMGRSLTRLLEKMHPEALLLINACGAPCNFAVAFGLTAALWKIPPQAALLGYLQSWSANLVNAAVKLIPLGQTIGQQVLLDLYPALDNAAGEILDLKDDELENCGWGLAIASMQHETLYSRLFRS